MPAAQSTALLHISTITQASDSRGKSRNLGLSPHTPALVAERLDLEDVGLAQGTLYTWLPHLPCGQQDGIDQVLPLPMDLPSSEGHTGITGGADRLSPGCQEWPDLMMEKLR